MLKNMTRKSLALGAGLALAASGLTAAPAQAVATGQLWSAFGQTNEMVGVANGDFTLQIANPVGINIAASSTDDTGIAVQVNTLKTRVLVVPVPRAGFADPTVTFVNAIAATTVPNAADTVTVHNITAAAVDGSAIIVNTGRIVLGAPSALTANLSVDVTIVYVDGQRSETERVTFVPPSTVSAILTSNAVQVGDTNQNIGGTFELEGINTGNWISSNVAVVQATTADDDLGLLISNGGVAANATVFSYSAITDKQSFSLADQTVAAGTVSVSATFDSTEINAYFVTGATAAIASFVVSAVATNGGMDVSIGTGTTVAQNNTAVATSTVAAEAVVALTGTKSLNFAITSFTDIARTTASGSGVPIVVTLTDTANGLGTSTITAGGKSLDVTGSAISFNLTTNSSGQVAFTVTADNADAGESFTMTAEGPNSADTADLDSTTVSWADATWTLLPAVDGNFAIAPGGSLAVDYTVVDQFGNLAGTEYQLAMTRAPIAAVAANRNLAAEYANWSYAAPVSATGRASATIVDNGLAATEGSDTVTVSLQKAATAGGAYIAEANSTNDTFVLTYENDLAAMTATSLVNNDGIANAAAAALVPLKLETVALVDYDTRLGGAKPLYATDGDNASGNVANSGVGAAATYTGTTMLRVYGVVKTAANAGVSGVAVRISGEGANFANASTLAAATLMLNDSITVFTDATGSYEAFVRSGKAGTQTLSVNAQGATSSVDVRFESSTGVATGLTLVGPTSVAPGARADFTATVVDKFGKAVSGVNVTFKDNGPGVLNTTAAVATDAFGEAQATLTTLAAESGTTVVTAYATIGGVIVTQTATITVGAAAGSSDVVVNVGTFNGKLVVYAKNASSHKISYKIAGKWVVQNPTSDTLQRYDRLVGANGVTVLVDIYVDGVKKLSKSVVTK